MCIHNNLISKLPCCGFSFTIIWKSGKAARNKKGLVSFIREETWEDMVSYASGIHKWFPLDLSNTTIFKFMLQIAKTQQTRLMMALHWDIFTQLSIFFIFTCVTVQLIRTLSLKPPKNQNKRLWIFLPGVKRGYEGAFIRIPQMPL